MAQTESSSSSAETVASEGPDKALCFNHLHGRCQLGSRCSRVHVADVSETVEKLSQIVCPSDGSCRLSICPYKHVLPFSGWQPNKRSKRNQSEPEEVESFQFQPIGVAKSCYTEKFGTPRQSGLVTSSFATIELRKGDKFTQAVDGLESFSHIWLVYVFHKDIERREWRPYIETPRENQLQKVGVLACRSPHRPNPIGMSAVELKRIEKVKGQPVRLHVTGVDLLDGTPILDIKPYVVYADSIPNATMGWIKGTINRYDVEFADGLAVDEAMKELIKDTLALDPRPVAQRKRWPVGDPESERELFAFRLGLQDIKWVIRGTKFVVQNIETCNEAALSNVNATKDSEPCSVTDV